MIDMRVLSIGTDRKLLEENSSTRARHEAYAKCLGALDIIVFTRSRDAKAAVYSGTLTVIPTNSHSRLLYGLDAFLIAKKVSKPDVVTAQDPFETGLVGLFIAWWLGVPLHVQVHTDFTSPAFSSFLNRLRRVCARFVLRRASRIRVILERTREDIRARGISKPITVLPIFVDVETFARISRLKHPRFKIALLCVGRFEPEKRFRLAIDALRQARAAGHDAGLTLVGAGSEEEHLRAAARTLGLEQFVEFAGWQGDIAPYLSTADILLVPSRYEGYGVVIVEALAAGVPVLSTDVGIAREAGAMIAAPSEFSRTLLKWISGGPRKGELHGYPYRNFEEYVKAYCDDLSATR